MPHHKSASKRLKTNEKSRQRNLAVKSALRKQLKRQANNQENPAESLPATYAELDRAAKKGVIPKTRASRLKSRAAVRAAKTAAGS